MQKKLSPEERANIVAEKRQVKAEVRAQTIQQVKKQRELAASRKKMHSEIVTAIKGDKNNQAQYAKEEKTFKRDDKKAVAARVAEVKTWYESQDKTDKDVVRTYKWKMQEAKRPNYDFSGIIKFENISYAYGVGTPFEHRALDGVNGLEIQPGKITAVIGMTGSGKSTLIQLTNGLILPSTGRTLVGNYQLYAGMKKIHEVKPLRKEIGLVFQFPEYQLFQDTIEKDISFGPINLGRNKSDVVKEVPGLLKLVDLPEDYLKRSPFDLSGGQKRRVAIAGIIATDGNTLVLDEPTGGLDPQGEEDFMNIFNHLNKDKGKRIIIVTHNMDHVLKIADEVIVMHEGRVIATGSPFEVFSNQKLLEKIKIEPPKVYKLAFKLKEQGLDVTKKEFRTIEDFAKAIKETRK
jgi:energy-coupling factor transport system ATP-binding protein